jgi:SAM-dependent methyltransferase
MNPRRPIGLAPGASRDAAGQDAAKYGSSNPVVRLLFDRWITRLHEVVGTVTGTVVDVGTGEGMALERVLGGPRVRPNRVVGVEYRRDKAMVARRARNFDVVVGDAGMIPCRNRVADLVLCIEVLEHLPRVAPAVAELARVTAIATGRCVLSVPWEPWFCLGNLGRGKNLSRLGNDPEHIGWFTRGRLRHALDPYFEAVDIFPAFPWLVAMASRPRQTAGDGAIRS